MGIGCYIRSFASSPDIEMESEVTDDAVVQTGKMVAIKMTENVRQLEQTSHRRYAIFTDSLSTIHGQQLITQPSESTVKRNRSTAKHQQSDQCRLGTKSHGHHRQRTSWACPSVSQMSAKRSCRFLRAPLPAPTDYARNISRT